MRKLLSVLILMTVVLPFLARPSQAQASILTSLRDIAEAFVSGREDNVTNLQISSGIDVTTKTAVIACSILNVGESLNEDNEPVGGCANIIDAEVTNVNPITPNDGSLAPFQGSAVGMLLEGISTMYAAPAANTQTYIADVGSRAGFISPAYAQFQGIGFPGLAPLLGVWRGFRNVAYGFLILAMVVIGFMIMFRRRIDPRTVMTVQNALPRIVLTLILITFSYAIVGLLIDLIYVVIGISFVAIADATTIDDVTAAVQDISRAGFPGVTSLIGIGLGSIDSVAQIFSGIVGVNTETTGFALLAAGGALALASIPIAGIGFGLALLPTLVGGAIAGLPLLIVVFAILFAVLRLFFTLLAAYIQLIISTIFAPILIMFGAIPGNNAFGNWVRGIVANLSVFVVTAVLLVLSGRIAADVFENGQLWAPPGLAGNVAQGAGGIIGLGFALAIPNVANGIKQMLGARSPIQTGPSVLLAPLGAVAGAAQQLVYFKSAFRGGPSGIEPQPQQSRRQ